MRTTVAALAASITLVSSLAAQTSHQPMSLASPPTHLGTYDLATGRLHPNAAQESASKILFDNTADNGSFFMPGTSMTVMDWGVVDTNGHHEITGLKIGYATTSLSKIDIGIRIHAGATGFGDPGAIVADFVINGLPGSSSGSPESFTLLLGLLGNPPVCLSTGPVGYSYQFFDNETGPLLVEPPVSLFVADAYDAYDHVFAFAYLGTFDFAGSPFASFYMQITGEEFDDATVTITTAPTVLKVGDSATIAATVTGLPMGGVLQWQPMVAEGETAVSILDPSAATTTLSFVGSPLIFGEIQLPGFPDPLSVAPIVLSAALVDPFGCVLTSDQVVIEIDRELPLIPYLEGVDELVNGTLDELPETGDLIVFEPQVILPPGWSLTSVTVTPPDFTMPAVDSTDVSVQVDYSGLTLGGSPFSDSKSTLLKEVQESIVEGQITLDYITLTLWAVIFKNDPNANAMQKDFSEWWLLAIKWIKGLPEAGGKADGGVAWTEPVDDTGKIPKDWKSVTGSTVRLHKSAIKLIKDGKKMKRSWPKAAGPPADPGVPEEEILPSYKYVIVHEMRHVYQHCKNQAADAAGDAVPFPGPEQLECDAIRHELKWGKPWPPEQGDKQEGEEIPPGGSSFAGSDFSWDYIGGSGGHSAVVSQTRLPPGLFVLAPAKFWGTWDTVQGATSQLTFQYDEADLAAVGMPEADVGLWYTDEQGAWQLAAFSVDMLANTVSAPGSDDARLWAVADRNGKKPTWFDLNNGLAGFGGTPQLSGTGTLQPVTLISLDLTNALPFSLSALVIGFFELALPLKGGVLVPSPDMLIFGLPTDANGDLSLPALWPNGLPSGITLYFQHWIIDAGGPSGFSASNGLAGTTP